MPMSKPDQVWDKTEIMKGLGLDEMQQEALREIKRALNSDSRHLINKGYPPETIINLIHVFGHDVININHLSKQDQNNPEIRNAFFKRRDPIDELTSNLEMGLLLKILKMRHSALAQILGSSFTANKKLSAELISKYSNQIDFEFFLEIILHNPNYIRILPPENTCKFLRDQRCRDLNRSKKFFELIYDIYIDIQEYDYHSSIDENAEILIELYLNYDREILEKLNESASATNPPANKSALLTLIKNVISRYSYTIDLNDVLAIPDLINQNSIEFNYDLETLKLSYSGVSQTGTKLDGSRQLSKENDSWKSTLAKMAEFLSRDTFLKLLSVIPAADRAYYIFFGTSGFTVFDKLGLTKIDKQFIELISPSKSMEIDEFTAAKNKICASLNSYSSRWKLSIFGHHHEERVRQLLKTISLTTTLTEIDLLLANQIGLMENCYQNSVSFTNEMPESRKKYFLSSTLFKALQLNSNLSERWFHSSPINLPDQKNLMSSGYYRALTAAKDMVAKLNVVDEDVVSKSVSAGPGGA